MASSMTAAMLYACTVSAPSALGAVPEDAPDKKHHLKKGVGFTNPWESWVEMSGPQIARSMIWYLPLLSQEDNSLLDLSINSYL